jgi:tetratricopeptide (TPR) repeat protein
LEDRFLSRNHSGYGRLLETIQRIVIRMNILKTLSLHLGKGERYLTNLFSEPFNIHVTAVFEIADFCGVPVSWLLDKAKPRPPALPEDQLLLECEGARLPANLFLDTMASRLSHFEKMPVEKQEGLCCYRPLLDELEEERFFDRESAQSKTEALAELLFAEMTATRCGPLSARRMGELGATIALWASIQRTHGLRDLAAKALIVAFPLVRRSGSAWAHGSCLQRASHVLRDFDRPDLAVAMLQEALTKFTTAEAWLEVWRTYVDRGTHYSSFPDYAESTDAYEVALEHLPASDWRFRAGALQGLATNAHKQGKLIEAQALILRAVNECAKPNHITAFLRWREAAIHFDLGRIDDAVLGFHESLALMGKFASAGDIALVALDYAEVLLRAEKLNRFEILVREVTEWLPALRSNVILHRTFLSFVDLARLSQLSLADIESTRHKVEAIGRGEVLLPS